MARGVSTVVDVSVALLLVSASVVTLVGATPPTNDGGEARTAAALLAATSARIDTPERTVSGPVAGLLAVATHDASESYEAAVRRHTLRALDSVSGPTQVLARPLDGEEALTVGSGPPPGVAVSAASFVVPPARNRTAVRVVVRAWSP